MVGLGGFEPPASSSRTKRSTKLSHSPTFLEEARAEQREAGGSTEKGSAGTNCGTDRAAYVCRNGPPSDAPPPKLPGAAPSATRSSPSSGSSGKPSHLAPGRQVGPLDARRR